MELSGCLGSVCIYTVKLPKNIVDGERVNRIL